MPCLYGIVLGVINSVILKTVDWKHNIFNILHLLSGIATLSSKVCEVNKHGSWKKFRKYTSGHLVTKLENG